MNPAALQLWVFDHERSGATFYARGMIRQQDFIPKDQSGKLTDPNRGRYLIFFRAHGIFQDAHSHDEAQALQAIRWIIDNNTDKPVSIWLHVDADLAEKIKPLYGPNVTEQPPPGLRPAGAYNEPDERTLKRGCIGGQSVT